MSESMYPEVIQGHDHTVLVKTPIIPGKTPHPETCYKVNIMCNEDYVKLPFSEKNVTENEIEKWNSIRDALNSDIISSHQLEIILLSYNKTFTKKWNFSALRSFFDTICDEKESSDFFQTLLPKMKSLALCLPELITGGIPLLKCGRTHSITLSQIQIASLLANAFFLTFPLQHSDVEGLTYANYSMIDFTRFFNEKFGPGNGATFEKIRCILHYFQRVTATPPTGVVTYSRHFLPESRIPDWENSDEMLPNMCVCPTGTIEDVGLGLLHVDLSYKLVGRNSVANEYVHEHKIMMYPELILSGLFTESLKDNEALIVTGCERFNRCKGYGDDFKWDSTYVDTIPSDIDGRKYSFVVTFDSLFFNEDFSKEQYSSCNMNQELNNMYAGFSWGNHGEKATLTAIATGNWSYGDFHGDTEFEIMLKLMAAAQSNRFLVYFTFDNRELADSIRSFHQFLISNEITVGEAHFILLQYLEEKFKDKISVEQYFRDKVMSNVFMEKENEDDSSKSVGLLSRSVGLLAITRRSFCFKRGKDAIN